eukprot:1489292-Rhodomonas_salina.1
MQLYISSAPTPVGMEPPSQRMSGARREASALGSADAGGGGGPGASGARPRSCSTAEYLRDLKTSARKAARQSQLVEASEGSSAAQQIRTLCAAP